MINLFDARFWLIVVIGLVFDEVFVGWEDRDEMFGIGSERDRERYLWIAWITWERKVIAL